MEFIKGKAKNVKMKYYKKQGNETIEKNYTTSDETNVTINSQFFIEKQKITFTKRRGL